MAKTHVSTRVAVREERRLTKRARAIMRLMVEPKDGDDGQLVGESGQWWVDLERTSWSVVRQLLKLCLIRLEYEDNRGNYQQYAATDEARKILDDPSYVTMIERAKATGKPVYAF